MNKECFYTQNSVIHKNRRLDQHVSPWVRAFDCRALKPLIVCRGPIRKEVMDVFEELGIDHYGILLSEKDSIVYAQALAPELRQLTDPHRIHRVPDYTGIDKSERAQRVAQIIRIAQENNYNSIFAGYGFMAEDEGLVKAIEESGLRFIGPCSRTVRQAGQKDEAKRMALQCEVSVTPGIDELTTLALLRQCSTLDALKKCAHQHELLLDARDGCSLNEFANHLLHKSYEKGIDIIGVEDVAEEAGIQVETFWKKFPENRIRLKAIGGGGGKGQRILAAPSSFSGSDQERTEAACAQAPIYIREILQEVKANGVGDNKNVLIELNIETIRHQEVQVIGNGEWCMTLGARDCSLQMHEQKLVEVSQTQEELLAAIQTAKEAGELEVERALETDLNILAHMEGEAAKFGEAVGLDSVSTFECIVDKGQHFFMEMNTRIQVEHRVTELVYQLRFTNPGNEKDYFEVDSLVELMCLLAAHKTNLPKPTRIPRFPSSVEIRLNATNAALSPHAGGQIQFWSDPISGEIRDDQGICVKNPDTKAFMRYTLAGAYDSNIALLLTQGDNRHNTYENMAEVLRQTQLSGENLQTNLSFHYGIIHWLLSENVRAKSTTQFVVPYLTLVGLLKQTLNNFDVGYAYSLMMKTFAKHYLDGVEDEEEIKRIKSTLVATFNRKKSLILRPIEALIKDPHKLSGWLSMIKADVKRDSGGIVWLKNPLQILANTYHFLNMDYRPDLPAAQCIWSHDHELLEEGLGFYQSLENKWGQTDYVALNALLAQADPVNDCDHSQWQEIVNAHIGFQLGLDVFNAFILMAESVDFYAFKVNPDLTPVIPERLKDEDLQKKMAKVLVPPPATKADEIVAACGGMFYGQETPDHPAFVTEGSHFEKGQPLYIIEVMKMFNKILAPFSGTVDKVLIDNSFGEIVKQSQPLFKVTPDERLEEVDPEEERRRITEQTQQIVLKAINLG